MPTARETYASSINSANMTAAANRTLKEMARQTTRDANNSVVGFTTQSGNMANLQTAVNNANAGIFSGNNSGVTNDPDAVRKASEQAAKEVLRGTGDLNSF
jgi:hypothetical protein